MTKSSTKTKSKKRTVPEKISSPTPLPSTSTVSAAAAAAALHSQDESQQEPDAELTSTLSLSDINGYTDADLDALLEKATEVLKERSALLQAEDERNQAEAEASGSVYAKEKKPSLLKSINLDPNLKKIDSTNSYLVQSSEKGAVRLNPSKFEIVETRQDVGGGSTQAVTKGLGRGDSKGLLDRIVVTKPQNQVPPELDLDEKKKKKMVVETSGPKWFNMPAPDLTDKLKLEVQIIKARNVLDPKHHYRRPDTNAPTYPKFFQMGTVIEGAADFHSARLAKRDRKEGLVEEVMADDKTKTYLKRKFGEIRERNQARAKRPMSKKKRTGPAAKGAARK
ncbi:Fcf2 pre-rRNA processing-domain-containing protein [Obelidium mucronatum]|nr:Fcf2 pre-rRNA processing-domain-containing protein [Obelidium mucronatum]